MHAVVVTAGQGTRHGSMACLSGCLLTGRLLDLPALHIVDYKINAAIKHGKCKLGSSISLCK